jgi:hypothetical protein
LSSSDGVGLSGPGDGFVVELVVVKAAVEDAGEFVAQDP